MKTLRDAIRHCSWEGVSASPRARAVAIVLMAIVPGGFIVPACYAAYVAARHARSR